MTMFQPHISFHYKHRCPKCETINWTYHSHSERHEPIYEPEICTCHACGQDYWLMSEETVEELYGCYREGLEEGETLEDVCGACKDVGKPNPG